MSNMNKFNIVIVGSGFAAAQCALALSQQLPNNITLCFVQTSATNDHDFLYGNLTSPNAYQNNLKLQVSEPEIMLNTNSSFSFGTSFTNWGPNKHRWMQCFHLPLPVEASVGFQHFMTRHNAQLSDYLISAQAAQLGRFAHPPESKPSSALSRAEYGYHFNPQDWATLYSSKLDTTKITVIASELVSVTGANNTISSLTLENGQHIEADLFVDCSGVKRLLIKQLDGHFNTQRTRAFQQTVYDVPETGPAYRTLNGCKNGWDTRTPLQQQDYVVHMRNTPPNNESNDAPWQEVAIGQLAEAWVGNCVAIGNAAYTMESISTAPYILLNKDVERLLALIPIDTNIEMERKEYNRRYHNDMRHAALFHEALYFDDQDDDQDDAQECEHTQCQTPEPSQRGSDETLSDMLQKKITQFEHRGVLANYDLEPFNDEDWLILHFGMNRRPKHYYEMADQVSMADMSAKLEQMRKGIAHLASQMPSHHIYLQKFLQFLRKNHAQQ